jgi:hypothetical protein
MCRKRVAGRIEGPNDRETVEACHAETPSGNRRCAWTHVAQRVLRATLVDDNAAARFGIRGRSVRSVAWIWGGLPRTVRDVSGRSANFALYGSEQVRL